MKWSWKRVHNGRWAGGLLAVPRYRTAATMMTAAKSSSRVRAERCNDGTEAPCSRRCLKLLMTSSWSAILEVAVSRRALVDLYWRIHWAASRRHVCAWEEHEVHVCFQHMCQIIPPYNCYTLLLGMFSHQTRDGDHLSTIYVPLSPLHHCNYYPQTFGMHHN